MDRQPGPPSIRCDVFIAGSGLVGSTFARLLADRGARVVMADPGDFHSRRAGENRKNSWLNQRDLVQYGHFVRAQLFPVLTPPNGPGKSDAAYPAAMVSYAVGGMAVHWTCAIPEFHSMERVPFIDGAEWRALYDRAGVLLNRHTDVFEGSARHQAIKKRLENGGWEVLTTPMAAERKCGEAYVTYTGADTVLGDRAGPGAVDGLQIMAEHCVRRLVRRAGGDSDIEYAEVMNMRSGAVLRIYADTFVVSAGWLHTAQILFASDIHTHEGSALGRYFSDHTFAACTVVLGPEMLKAVAAEAGVEEAAVPTGDPPPHLYLPVADDRPWQGMIFRESYQFDADGGGGEDLRGVDLKWFGMIEPTRDNGVTFSREQQDRLGMPTARFRLSLSEQDRARQDQMMVDMRAVAACLGPYRPGAEPNFAPLGSAIHGSGLTRMGAPDDQGEHSVVDPWSKVWGVQNLYLGGTSVIPTATAANPTFSAVALAIRAADSIAS